MVLPVHERVLFWGSSIVFFLNGCVFFCRELPYLWRLVCSGCRSVRRDAREWLRGRLRTRGEADFVQRAVREEIARQHARKMSWALCVLRHSMSLTTASNLVALVQLRNNHMSGAQNLTQLAVAGLVLLLSLLPTRIFNRFLDLWQSVFMLLGIIYMVEAPTDWEGLVPSSVLIGFLRIMFTWAQPKPGVSIVWNVLHLVMYMYAHNPDWGAGPLRVENTIFFLNIFLSIAVHVDVRVVARSVVRAKMLSCESSAMKRLLNLTCDVTVELDDGLCIVEPVPRLMAMLTLDHRKACVQGATLQQFMPHEEDRCRFESMLRASGGDAGTPGSEAGAVHVTLRASGSTLVQVEIFYVRFSALNNRGHYLAGIREFPGEAPGQLIASPSKHHVSAIEVRADIAMAGPHDGPSDQKAPARPQHECRGTPSHCPAGCLAATTRSSQPPSEISSLRARRLTLPGCEPTSDQAKEFSLITAMRSWNTSAQPLACCRFHSYVKDLRASAKRLDMRKCLQTFRVIADAQCRTCGMLCEWDVDEDEDEDRDDEQEPRYCACCSGRYIRPIPRGKVSL